MWYVSSWIDIKISIKPGGGFYDKRKKNDIGT